MRIIGRTNTLRKVISRANRSGRTVGLVPTMGYLHDGHLSLVRRARKECDLVVVSIFVNPIQFGPGEDLGKYPRNFKRDSSLLKSLDVDIIFAPSAGEMFPKGFSTFVEVPELGKKLCGRTRPVHFRGVTTVVAKLFNIVSPDSAYFGRKDYQQLVIIKKMVKDLCMDVKVIGLPTVRESDGLAMSSRNSYLSPAERRSAAVIYRALKHSKELAAKGVRSSGRIKSAMRRIISSVRPGAKIEYLEICDPGTFEPKKNIDGPTLVAVAAFVGRARLIDNILINP